MPFRFAGFEAVALAAFFLLDAGGLAFEVIGSKQLGYILEVDVYTATTVVMAFMGGLAHGWPPDTGPGFPPP